MKIQLMQHWLTGATMNFERFIYYLRCMYLWIVCCVCIKQCGAGCRGIEREVQFLPLRKEKHVFTLQSCVVLRSLRMVEHWGGDLFCLGLSENFMKWHWEIERFSKVECRRR